MFPAAPLSLEFGVAKNASVAIRLGTEGKDDVVRDFKQVGDAGDAAADRAARAFERASEDIEAAQRKQAAAAAKIAAIMPQTTTQMRVNDSVGTGSTLNEGSARVSAAAFRELLAEQERYEASALRMRAALDPVWAAQQRYNSEMTEARLLVANGSITLDEYCAKLRLEKATLDDVAGSQQRVNGTSGAMRAGMQQLGFQAQDFAVQVIGGTDAVRAFAMQAPQAIGALQLMSGQAENGGGKFAKFASILGGPVGVAIGVAIPLAVMLGEKFFNMGDDADGAANKVDRLGDALKRLKNEQATQGDIGEIEKKLNSLRDQRLAIGSDPNARRARGGESQASMQQRRAVLDREIADLQQQIAWNEVAQRGRSDASAYKATPPAAKTDGGGRSRSTGGTTPAPKPILDVEAIFKSNTTWGHSQETGGAARDSLTNEGQALMDQQKLIKSMNDDISAGTMLLNVEWETRGKSRLEIEAAVELKRYEIDLQRQGLDLSSAEAQALIARKAGQIAFTQALDASVDKMTALRDIGVDVAGNVLNPQNWTSWKNVALSAIGDVTSAFWKLAVVNPIQNKISGGNLPTIGSLFGLFKGSGASAGGSAIGNNYTSAGTHLVGENGPEFVELPQGAKVMTASETRRVMGANDNGLQVRVIKGDLFDVEVTRISAGVSVDTVASAAPVIAVGASNGAQQAVAKRNGRRLA